MKGNELAIGDYLEILDKSGYYKVTGINLLSKGDACELQSHDDNYVHTWCDRVMPIEVTPDLLQKIGFMFGLTSKELSTSVKGLYFEGVMCHFTKRWIYEQDEHCVCVTFPAGCDGGMIEVHNEETGKLLSFTFDGDLFLHTIQQAARLCGVELNNLKL